MEKVLRRFTTHQEAENADKAEYRRMSPEDRLEMSLRLRRMWLGEEDATEQRLERVLTRAQLPRR
jgi:hypothetical protein